jgi:hypothetical protein
VTRKALIIAVLWVSLSAVCRAGQPGALHPVEVDTDRPARITWTTRGEGQAEQTFADDGLDNRHVLQIRRDARGRLPALTVRAVAPDTPFTHYEKSWKHPEGRELHYLGTSGQEDDVIHLDLERVVDWTRIAAALVGGALVILVGVGMSRRSLRRNLEVTRSTLAATRARLTEAELRTGLFPADGSLPDRIGPYSVVDRLGSGGMAVVYRVADERGGAYALKLPLPQCLQDDDFKRRFQRELKIGVRLLHPNLVRIIDVNAGLDGDEYRYPFLVMELVEGQSLQQLMRRRRFQVDAALDVAAQLLDALGYVHGHGVVHRDVKPGNVMIARGKVKLMDFGVAHRKDTVARPLTATGDIIGTPAYMAPEQVSAGGIDARTDLYAVGVLVYEMLAGGLPFSDDTMQVVYQKVHEDLPSIAAARPDVPDGVACWLERLLARDPEARWPSAAAARAGLEGL